MKLTKIEVQKNNKDRYSLYVDNEFAFGVHEDVLIQFGLFESKEITESQLEEIKQAEFNSYIYQRALNYLSYRPRSVKEMADYLIGLKLDDFPNGVPRDVIDASLEKLKQHGYLDDKAFAQSYIRTKSTINLTGPQNIRFELERKGVHAHDIEDGLVEYPVSLQEENINQLAEKFIKSKHHRMSTNQLTQKLRQHLIRKGYDQDVFNPVIENLQVETEPEIEESLLNKEAEKLWRRRKKKYTGYDLKNQLIKGLLAKGFNYDDIQAFLADNQYLYEEGD